MRSYDGLRSVVRTRSVASTRLRRMNNGNAPPFGLYMKRDIDRDIDREEKRGRERGRERLKSMRGKSRYGGKFSYKRRRIIQVTPTSNLWYTQ